MRGETVTGERAQLAALAETLAELRPEPTPAFAHALAGRAAQGFARERRTPRRPDLARGLRAATSRSGAHRRPALAAALAAVLGLTAALALALPGGGNGPSQRTPATSRGVSAVNAAPEAPRGAAAAPAVKGQSSSGAAAGGPAPQASPPAAATAGRQVEHSAALDVGVAPDAMQATAQRVFSLVSGYGGYVRSSNVSSGGSEGEGGASFDARVPSGRLPATIAALSQLGHVRSENEGTNDVTERYGSLQRSLGDARAQRASLLAQLAAAREAARATRLEATLHGVERRIGGLEVALRTLRTRIDYTPLAVSLTPERASGSGGLGTLSPGDAAGTAAQVLGVALAVLLIALAAAVPLAAVALAAWLALALGRRRLREQALDA